MGKFEFKKKLVLDIAGEQFEVDSSSPELIENVMEFSDKAMKISSEIGQSENYTEALKDTIQFCCDSIDTILGEGATKSIFKDRKISLFDALDVLNYITDEINKDRDSKFKQYSPNRAQRRTKK